MKINFTEVVHATKKVVLSAIESHLSERYVDYIDDIVQETYIRAYKALEKNQFREESELTTYLYAIAKNETFRMISKLKKEEAKQEKLLHEKKELFSYIPSELNPLSIDLIDFIKKIPVKYREVMELYIYGSSEKEISNQLNLKPGTVKSRTSRGKEFLRKIIGE